VGSTNFVSDIAGDFRNISNWVKSKISKKPKNIKNNQNSQNHQNNKNRASTGFYSRGYSSYNYGDDSGGAKWPYGLSADGSSRIIDHYLMRQNARDAFHDSMDARAIVERMADSVVDIGLILDATPDHEILGIAPEQAEKWGADISRRFHLWAKDKKQNRSGVMNFYQAQRLYEIMQQRDNDIFVRFYYSKKKTLQNSLQYEFIDANQIRGCGLTDTYAQFDYQDGIKRNSDGTEKSYLVWFTDPKDGKYKEVEIQRKGAKSGKTQMIHGFNPEYAGQRRGYSRIGFAIQELENITDLTLAQIKKAINQSNLVLSIENEIQTPGNTFSTLSPDVSATGERLTATPTPAELSRDIRVCPVPEANLDTPGSLLAVGNEQGDKIKMLENKTPAESFSNFVQVFTERLAAAAGIPIEVVLMKFGQNYSASRATLIMFWRIVQMWREEMATDFLNEIYIMWLSEEISSGRITAMGWQDPVLRAAWISCQWIGAPLPSIDPKKESDARKNNLEMNLTTLEREARNLNGSSAVDNILKNQKTFPELPIPSWGSNSAVEIEDEEEDENGE